MLNLLQNIQNTLITQVHSQKPLFTKSFLIFSTTSLRHIPRQPLQPRCLRRAHRCHCPQQHLGSCDCHTESMEAVAQNVWFRHCKMHSLGARNETL
ncbi:hypothetical protein GLYMA_10G173900v4 [Glycine max]|uniref:Uncharacterized protein n=2 Tax=Glycine subgen. Soja TaxID=1462606 RepID=A0A0R0I2E7_SOYBN|nr:hypothetical protein JHK85_029120 [Glycine max]KAG5004436.1 hypothetical protein JHK86_028575 [Glycine max]KAH1138759.1 hypothetical protein GYH30_028298 [Glycine max]KRH34275.1 hypothetical protein GLYMA_10G173900v4 [Glycine max]RZB87754.1 hypothetical protein D0Y65_027347 [Glycine soja]